MSHRHELIRAVAWAFVLLWVLYLLALAASHTAPAPPQHTTRPIIFHDLKCYPPESAEYLRCDYPKGPR